MNGLWLLLLGFITAGLIYSIPFIVGKYPLTGLVVLAAGVHIGVGISEEQLVDTWSSQLLLLVSFLILFAGGLLEHLLKHREYGAHKYTPHDGDHPGLEAEPIDASDVQQGNHG